MLASGNPNNFIAERHKDSVVNGFGVWMRKAKLISWYDLMEVAQSQIPAQDSLSVGTWNSTYLNFVIVLTSLLHFPPIVSKIPMDLLHV